MNWKKDNPCYRTYRLLKDVSSRCSARSQTKGGEKARPALLVRSGAEHPIGSHLSHRSCRCVIFECCEKNHTVSRVPRVSAKVCVSDREEGTHFLKLIAEEARDDCSRRVTGLEFNQSLPQLKKKS